MFVGFSTLSANDFLTFNVLNQGGSNLVFEQFPKNRCCIVAENSIPREQIDRGERADENGNNGAHTR